MLVLSRKPDESIRIDDHILVRVLGVKGRVVRLGIEAPSGVRVLRGELLSFEAASNACLDASVPEKLSSPRHQALGADAKGSA